MRRPKALLGGIALAGLLLVAVARFGAPSATLPAPPGTHAAHLPALPGWSGPAAGAPTTEPLPTAPSQAEVADFVAGSRQRFTAALPDRWQLALAERRLLGPDGAIALARGSGQPVDHPQREAVLVAVAGEVASAARRNDFAHAEGLLAALWTDERSVPALEAAAVLLEERRELWREDPARNERIDKALLAAGAGLAVGDRAGLEAALSAAQRLADDDPAHEAVSSIRAEVAARALDAWGKALDAEDWPSVERWSTWATRTLPAAERQPLAAATRAARERQAAPQPTP